MKCDIKGCITELAKMMPTRPRTDGILVIADGKPFVICTEHAKTLGFIKGE